MIDDSYAAALERAKERHDVLLGPLPCRACGAWVEWAGVDWLALGTDERHECGPFLGTWREHMQREFAKLSPQAEDAFRPYPRHLRPTTGLMQAHPLGTVVSRHGEWWEHRRAANRGRLLALTLLFVAALWVAALWVLASLWPAS